MASPVTSNTAEFVVALSASVGFLFGLGAHAIPWDAVIALMIGGVFAAPIAAWLVTKVPQRMLGLIVGFLIVLLNVRQLSLAFELPGAARLVVFAAIIVVGVFSLVWAGRTSLRRT